MIELVQMSFIFHHQSLRAICALGNRPCWQKGLQWAALLSAKKAPTFRWPSRSFNKKLEVFCGVLDLMELSTHPQKTSGFKDMLPDLFHMYGNMFICFIRKTSCLFSFWVNVGTIFHTWSINIWGGSLVSSENSRLVILIFLLD